MTAGTQGGRREKKRSKMFPITKYNTKINKKNFVPKKEKRVGPINCTKLIVVL